MTRFMFTRRHRIRGFFLPLSLTAVLVAACDDNKRSQAADAGSDAGAPAMDAELDAATRQLAVTLVAGHSHIYKETKVTFRVVDKGNCMQETTDAGVIEVCQGVPGLNPVAFERAAGVDREQPLTPGIFVDISDGSYEWTKTFTVLGTNLLGIRFDFDGRPQYAAFPFETSRGGGERYFCDTNGDRMEDHAFQVRWNPTGSIVRANGMPTTIQVELMRSTNPPPINLEQPFRNSFEHLRPAELQGATPRIRLMAGSGADAAEVAALEPKYAGRGLYTVTKTFAPEDLAGTTRQVYWLRIGFTDDKGCVVDTVDEAEYQLPVVP